MPSPALARKHEYLGGSLALLALEIAQGKVQGPELAETGLLNTISQDLEKAIKESLAFWLLGIGRRRRSST